MTEYRGDCDCFYFDVQLGDEAFAHRLAQNHLDNRGYPEEHIDWSVIEG